ncbi:uncharacterized protein I206_106257 [Kwoniella pini CBS 10737]|uniref:Uncharacterized protein n=1 Tax=Kwoniella pini CBS 10737 TaxID=1296096 RepID=A0A1B9I1H2_9TREE|nr:uncharacterized protein I206_05083 [Kwoniella pini CBS 10737]OCF49390.1 hypothetical protein I206_05083 [Kwoniella pini CBS 10737]
MVLVGLLPILAFAGSIQAAAIPIDSPPASPALSLQGSSTFSPISTFSPQLNIPSPTIQSTISFPTNVNSSPSPEYQINSSGDGKLNKNEGSDFKGNTGIGRGKGMTNAERIKRGLGILPPTRRMSGKPSRRSEKPQIDLSQFQDPQSNSNSSVNDENPDINNNSNNNNNGDDDIANGNQGNTFAPKKYAMRMKNPDDGSDMGLVGSSNDNNPLIGYTPTTDNALKMTMPQDPTSTPFLISPNDNSNDGDDTFNGPRKVLAAVPHKGNNGSDLNEGDGNYAPMGMGWKDGSGILHLDIQALINSSTNNLPDSSNLPNDSTDVEGIPKQLLSRPGGSVLPISQSDLPIDNSNPIQLIHTSLSNLPINSSNIPLNNDDDDGNNLGNPQSTLWTFQPTSKRLLAHYVNSDGNAVPTYFVTGGECAHTICLTADVEAFKDAQGDDAHEIHVLAEAVADL